MQRGIGRLRAGGGWTPTRLASDLVLWLDAADFSAQFQDSAGTTAVTGAGQSVGKPLDKSGNGNHLVQAVAGSRPTLQQDASGFWYWNFDGTDDSWASSAALNLSGTDKITVVAGIHKQSDAATGIVCELTANTNVNAGSFYLVAPNTAGGSDAAFVARGTVLPAGAATASGWTAPSARVITTTASIATDSQTLRANGVAGTSSAADMGLGNFSSSTLNIGRRAGASLPFFGRIYQLLIVARVLSATEISQAEKFVGSRMGISL